MKILYVTDLHGDKKKYRKILDVAIEKEIKVIVNGGDMLPKQCDRHSVLCSACQSMKVHYLGSGFS